MESLNKFTLEWKILDKTDKRKNRVFVKERGDIEFIMWRKKVDASIFYDKAILIIKSYEKQWELEKYFKDVISKKNPLSEIPIYFEGNRYVGHVTHQKTGRNSFRLFYSKELANKLKSTFLMSFMRDLEFKLGNFDDDKDNRKSIEDIIPFNEFLDIEFNAEIRGFNFTAHFRQKPVFQNLFSKILDTTVLSSISDEIEGKSDSRIQKSTWLEKNELNNIPDQPNVLYTLLDIKNGEVYYGEAKNLKNRLSGYRPEIPGWTHFRYDVLPASLEQDRVELERMIIRQLASLFPNHQKLQFNNSITNFKLTNKKIDT